MVLEFAEFVSRVEALGYELRFRSRYRGYYRDAMPNLPTDHFAQENRLDFMVQLVFRRG